MDDDRVPEMKIVLDDCIVRAGAEKSSEALWSLQAGEVTFVSQSVCLSRKISVLSLS
jgi:hypothetical protein|eukprot:COSAG06_NODE_924_length_11533_cov_65.691998_8_plen_57_part_00